MVMSKKRRQEIATMRREQIMRTALKLFDEKGYRDTTMQDIADAAGISKGLIYRYFESKDELLDSFAELIEQCENETQSMPTATECLKLYTYRLLGDSSVTGYWPPLRVYVMCYIQGYLSEEMKEKYFNSDHGRRFFGTVIRKGQESGEFKAGDSDLMADVFWNFLIGYTATSVCSSPKHMEASDIDLMISQILK